MPKRPRYVPLKYLAILLLSALIPVLVSPTVAAEQGWRWPISNGDRALIRLFQAPASTYGAGHRGVDLAATVGQPVLAPASGTLVFNGLVARIPTLVIDHRGLRSSYQPVQSPLKVGQAVTAGSVIGVVVEETATGKAHCARTCLHFGVRTETGYLDPTKLIRATSPVLLPVLG